jgi:hypothetical protein
MLWERIYMVRKREKMLGNKKKNSSWDKNPHLLVSSDVMSYHVGYMCN